MSAYRKLLNYVNVFLAFLYICANPFVYAVKFNPVRRVLVGLIPWKKSQQAGGSVEVLPAPSTDKIGISDQRK